jgi:hypothetical protein
VGAAWKTPASTPLEWRLGLTPRRAPADVRRRPDGGIDTEHYAARARRLRRAGLRGHIAWLLAALR